ncbi:rab-GTPase-TBC domain-containing protein [Dipodascopsis tothii]|uniref:rab-GTPase-TBC domain-containing protein n=1 Tax=Dipodascopsis tothii TaxID=44089 RepID=UPI0034CFED26
MKSLKKSMGSNGRQEMVQLGRSEYVFAEAGGRGTSAAKLKGTPSGLEDYVLGTEEQPVGAGYSHADAVRLEQSRARPTYGGRTAPRPSKYRDLDADWDADVDAGDDILGDAASESGSERGGDLYPPAPRRASGLKPQFDGIVKDPANSLHAIYQPPVSPDAQTSAEIELLNARIARINKFKRVLQASNVDIGALKTLAWSGIPEELRPMSWQILLGYLPSNADRRVSTLARKRHEYLDGVAQAFERTLDHSVWHQIEIDVPRTNPHLKLYSFPSTQRALERILYVWAIRHPASGYVQGINDLVTPFFQVFLSAYIDDDVESYDPGQLPKEVLDVVEADTFWCLTKLLDGIQDNYIFAQPGIQRQVAALQELTQRIDASLVHHLHDQNVEFIQFSFRWMNCMLMREVSVKNTVRMWDTYMAEGSSGFSDFHLYVCAAFLVKWSAQIQTMDFQEILMFLQNLPTQDWGDQEIELLLSEAYMWQSLFKNATAHLR